MPVMMRQPTDVVQEKKNLDVGNAQASETRFEGALHAIAAVIEYGATSPHRKHIIERALA